MKQRIVSICDFCGEILPSNRKARQPRKDFQPKPDSRLNLGELKSKEDINEEEKNTEEPKVIVVEDSDSDSPSELELI